MTRESRETSAEPGPGHAPSLSSCMAHSVLSLSASVPSCEQGQGPSLEGLLGPSTYWWEPEPLLLFSPSLFFFFFLQRTCGLLKTTCRQQHLFNEQNK